MKCFRFVALLLFMCISWSTFAQELKLFEETDAVPQANNRVSRQPDRTPANTEPAFTLKSTSRFGDEYRTNLLSKGGDVVSVSLKKGESALITGYEGYSVVDIGSRYVSIRMPDDQPCVEAKDKGVSCAGSNLAKLTLANAKPLAAPREQPRANSGRPATATVATDANGPNNDSGNAQAQPVLINPFSGEPQVIPQISDEERQARAQRQAARAQRLQNFQPVRIPDDEVPQGMRKVSTPFGDRLVPENQ